MQSEIKQNYHELLEKIEKAATYSQRNSRDIQLVVVTKGQSPEKILQVVEAGATILGENYPEETHKKIAEIGEFDQKVEWHMIGHLQSRKIKYIVQDFSMIHSIDRQDVAEELDGKLKASMRTIPALFEVNLSGEESKYGYPAWDESSWSALIDELEKLNHLNGLEFRGFMTMPPFSENPENSRAIFKKCHSLLEIYQKHSGDDRFNQLSMGTSLDFGVAIEEGATYIRIGEAIMGKRL